MNTSTIKTAANAIFRKDGATGVRDFVNNLPDRLTESKFCPTCNEVVPVVLGDNECLICAGNITQTELGDVKDIVFDTLPFSYHGSYNGHYTGTDEKVSGFAIYHIQGMDSSYQHAYITADSALDEMKDDIIKLFLAQKKEFGFSRILNLMSDQNLSYDCAEVHPCRTMLDDDKEAYSEPCEEGQQDHYSVFLHIKPGQGDAGGLECIADFTKKDDADRLAYILNYLMEFN